MRREHLWCGGVHMPLGHVSWRRGAPRAFSLPDESQVLVRADLRKERLPDGRCVCEPCGPGRFWECLS